MYFQSHVLRSAKIQIIIVTPPPIFVLKIIKLVFPPLTLRYVCAHSERKHPDNQATKKLNHSALPLAQQEPNN